MAVSSAPLHPAARGGPDHGGWPMGRRRWLAVGLAVAALWPAGVSAAAPSKTVLRYDSFQKAHGAYTLDDYSQKWANPYGLSEMALTDTRNFSGGAFNVSAVPFRTA